MGQAYITYCKKTGTILVSGYGDLPKETEDEGTLAGQASSYQQKVDTKTRKVVPRGLDEFSSEDIEYMKALKRSAELG